MARRSTLGCGANVLALQAPLLESTFVYLLKGGPLGVLMRRTKASPETSVLLW